jgi:integrase
MKVKIKHVDHWKDRHGRERFYFRKGKGGRVPLRGPLGSSEFWEDYNDAVNGVTKVKPTFIRAQPESMRWLVEQYYQSSSYKEISDGYRKTRRGILDKFCEEHGHKRYTQLRPRHIRKFRDAMMDRPGSANNLLKALRQVFKYAVNYDYMDTNPVAEVERLKTKNKDGFHAWTLEEIEQFESTHPIGTKARLAFAFLLYTGQRRSDIVKMGRQHVKDSWLTVIQQKTGKRIEIPVLDNLQSIVDASETGDLTFLVTEYGKPFTSNGFGNWFRKKCNEAGLPQCSAHGVRKAAAAHLANIGCTVHEIMSITGHYTVTEVQRYTKAAQQKQLAERVRQRIDGQK